MGVDALHTDACATDTTRRSWTRVVCWDVGVALPGVTLVGLGDELRIEFSLDKVHRAFGFEPTGEHRLALTAQPVSGRHRRAVLEQRFIAQHDGVARDGAHDDGESALWGATEEFGDASAIVRARSTRGRGNQ